VASAGLQLGSGEDGHEARQHRLSVDRRVTEVGDRKSGGRQVRQGVGGTRRGGPKWATTQRSVGATTEIGHQPAEESSGTTGSAQVGAHVASDQEEGSCVWIRQCQSGVFYSR
jgi:hypothetical protein